MAAAWRVPALRLEVLLRVNREVELLLTLDTGQALHLDLCSTAGDAALRLPPALLLVEDLVGGRELELGLTLQAREHEASSLLGGAALLARLGLGEVEREEEVDLVLRHEEGIIAGAADELLTVLHCVVALGIGLGQSGRLRLLCLGATDLRGLALCVEALELQLEQRSGARGCDHLLVRVNELLDGEGHFVVGERGLTFAAAGRLQLFLAKKTM